MAVIYFLSYLGDLNLKEEEGSRWSEASPHERNRRPVGIKIIGIQICFNPVNL